MKNNLFVGCSDPDTRFYNLRSRNLTSMDTDSEDDEIPR